MTFGWHGSLSAIFFAFLLACSATGCGTTDPEGIVTELGGARAADVHLRGCQLASSVVDDTFDEGLDDDGTPDLPALAEALEVTLADENLTAVAASLLRDPIEVIGLRDAALDELNARSLDGLDALMKVLERDC